MSTALSDYERAVANAIISVDTLWGGDVNCRSGTGRVIADSYFSWKDLPEAYHVVEAAPLRKSGGVSAKEPDKASIKAYLARVHPTEHLDAVVEQAKDFAPLRKEAVVGLADALRVELDLALERIGEGPAVPYERCVVAAMGEPAREAQTKDDRERVRAMLGELGQSVAPGDSGLIEGVDAFRKKTWIGHEGIAKASDRVIAELETLVSKNFVPYLPVELRDVPRANVTFQLIEDAWFSGSMNYIGRDRREDGSPAYEAEYEINAKIEKSQAEFMHLVAHEVVPGHVTTFALIQALFHSGKAGFEATILTMNTRFSTLFEGIANAGLLMAYGARRVDELPTAELRLGVALSQLEDAAKNNASYYTYVDKLPADEIKRRLRNDCLATPERANKLTDAWAQHPLMGRAYMPSYRYGTDLVLALLEEHGPQKLIPVLYGAKGVCDCVTLRKLAAQG
jgi:hypothetical protein